MNIQLPEVLWAFQDEDRECNPRVYKLLLSNADGTGIDLFFDIDNDKNIIAVHPDTPVSSVFRIERNIDAVTSFHDKSYTLVRITRDSFTVTLSDRASDNTLNDIGELIRKCAARWSENRMFADDQMYCLKWNRYVHDYVVETVEFERDWGTNATRYS